MSVIELGDKAKDMVTGFEGVVTGKAEYITGCVRFQIECGSPDKKSKSTYSDWVDEVRLKLIKKGVFKPDRTMVIDKPAGPMSAPKQY
jgi:hypothetical protein